MKKLFYHRCTAFLILTLALQGCSKGKDPGSGSGPDNPSGSTSSAKLEVSMSGAINHTTYTLGQTASVSFNRFPKTVAEFKEVREKIGGEPHGAVALQIMAYEMYRRDRTIGEECVKLNNLTNNVTLPLSRLRELFGTDVNYARPYQMAAMLKGATPENGYNPTKPYTIEVRVSAGNPYQYSSIYQTNVLYLQLLTQGRDNGVVGVDVLNTLDPNQPSGGKYFIVFACSSVYSQVKAISFSATFKGLD